MMSQDVGTDSASGSASAAGQVIQLTEARLQSLLKEAVDQALCGRTPLEDHASQAPPASSQGT